VYRRRRRRRRRGGGGGGLHDSPCFIYIRCKFFYFIYRYIC
jgi:hypothetical protein